MGVDYRRVSELQAEEWTAMQCEESARLRSAVNRLHDRLCEGLPFDWRNNATHWAFDVGDVCEEISFSIAWMRAFTKYSAESDEIARNVVERLVSYYADNAAIRISSCRDKIALLAWSYYCPFNPENRAEVLSYKTICERLAHPIRFGLKLQGHGEFLTELNKLGTVSFEKAVLYRHRKIHRMEPRVTMHETNTDVAQSYMFALTLSKDIKEFDARLKKRYKDDDFRARIRERCFIDGVLFDRRGAVDLSWPIDTFNQFTHSCWKSLCDAAAGSCEFLLCHEPLAADAI